MVGDVVFIRVSHTLQSLQPRRVLVAENDPYRTPAQAAQPPREAPLTAQPVRRSSWTLSRIILLVVLALCVTMLGVDLVRGQWPLKRAKSKLLDAMAARSPADEDEKPVRGKMISGDLSPLTADEVHKIIGRDPSQTVTKPAKLGANQEIVETYDFPGVFRKYTLTCSYYKQVGGTALKRVESADGMLGNLFGH
jgi:hypothetical protein